MKIGSRGILTHLLDSHTVRRRQKLDSHTSGGLDSEHPGGRREGMAEEIQLVMPPARALGHAIRVAPRGPAPGPWGPRSVQTQQMQVRQARAASGVSVWPRCTGSGPLGGLLGPLGRLVGFPRGRRLEFSVRGLFMDPCRGRLGALLGCLGCFLCCLGAFLGRLGAVLGASWAVLGRFWGPHAPSWGVDKAKKTTRPQRFKDLSRKIDGLPQLGALRREASWRIRGPSWSPSRPSWGHLLGRRGAIVRRLGACPGSPEGLLRPSGLFLGLTRSRKRSRGETPGRNPWGHAECPKRFGNSGSWRLRNSSGLSVGS